MTIHTHPVLEGPFVFLPIPTPSLRDQLKLKRQDIRDSTKRPVSPWLGTILLYLTPAKKILKSCPKSGQMEIGSNTETTDENKHRKVQLNLPHTPPAPQPESNNRQTQLALAASTSYLFRHFIAELIY